MRRLAVLPVLAAALLALVACSATAPDDATCDRDGTCTDLTLEQVEEVSGLDLPDGTEVVESSYQEFQDWHLTATLRLPAGAASPLPASGEEWDGTLGDDGIQREAHERTDDEDRTVLEIEVFST